MINPVDNLLPINPGRFLRVELEALEMSARKIAAHVWVPHNSVSGIMNGERSTVRKWRSGSARRLARRSNIG
jgi:plasmid maintenance system antidote protein VapI